MQEFKKAEKLLRRFKAGKYHFGQGILEEALKSASCMGRKAILFRGSFPGSDAYVDMIVSSLKQSGTILNGVFKGARPNSPQEDVQGMVASIDKTNPDFV
ncbi:MAG: iron-containing alcohol dehydrogenase, partial [Candidatus Humimicrobiaceae bacterium]